MKFLVITLALLGAVAADVKHLNNMYLPPHVAAHKRVEYAQKSLEIPQGPLPFGAPVEITDNSVTEQVENQNQNQEQQYFTGKIKADDLRFGLGYEGEIQSNTEDNKYYTGAIVVPHPEIPTAQVETEEKKYYTGLVYKPGQEDSTTINAETSVPAPGSDAFTQQQATYYTSLGQQNEAAAPVAQGSIEDSGPAPGSDSFTQQQATFLTRHGQNQETENKYYTGLIAPSQGDSVGSTSISTNNAVEQESHTDTNAPAQEDSSAITSTSTTTHVDQVSQEPERQYYTGLIAPDQGSTASVATTTATINPGASVPVPVPGSADFAQQQAIYYTSLAQQQGAAATFIPGSNEAFVPPPGSDSFTQQQAAYWTQQSQNQAAQMQYYTGLVYNHGQEAAGNTGPTSTTTTTTVVQPQSLEFQRNYYTGLVHNPGQEAGHAPTIVEQQSISLPAPGSDALTQQQAAYYASISQQPQSGAPASGATSGIDTQYAADGGYVY